MWYYFNTGRQSIQDGYYNIKIVIASALVLSGSLQIFVIISQFVNTLIYFKFIKVRKFIKPFCFKEVIEDIKIEEE